MPRLLQIANPPLYERVNQTTNGGFENLCIALEIAGANYVYRKFLPNLPKLPMLSHEFSNDVYGGGVFLVYDKMIIPRLIGQGGRPS